MIAHQVVTAVGLLAIAVCVLVSFAGMVLAWSTFLIPWVIALFVLGLALCALGRYLEDL